MSEVPLFLHNPKPGIPSADRGVDASSSVVYRGTSLIRNNPPVGPYRKPMPRVLGGS